MSYRIPFPGLRDLVDFLPASLATIISYFSAEVTRGIWKPVSMNGTDWPSPAANFATVESEIKDILAAAGVTIPSSSSGRPHNSFVSSIISIKPYIFRFIFLVLTSGLNAFLCRGFTGNASTTDGSSCQLNHYFQTRQEPRVHSCCCRTRSGEQCFGMPLAWYAYNRLSVGPESPSYRLPVPFSDKTAKPLLSF